MLSKLYIGTAGNPRSTPTSKRIDGLYEVKKHNLDAMELEFVRGVNLRERGALEIKKIAQQLDIKLTAHGPYYINLNAQEKEKREASKKRIYDTAKIAALAGGYSITFHAAYYLKQDPEKVYNVVKESLKEITKKLNFYPVYL